MATLYKYSHSYRIWALTGLIVCFFTTISFAQWTTSGSNIYNTNTGNVGIGTTNPSTKLHVTGGGVTVGTNVFGATPDGHLSIGDVLNSSTPTSSTNAIDQTTLLLNAKDYSTIGFHHLNSRMDFIRVGNGKIDLGYNGGWGRAHIGFANGIWDADGNLGIGTTSPTARLHVNGSVRVGWPGTFLVDDNGISGGRFSIQDNGKVSIGTTATLPYTKLLVNGDGGIMTAGPGAEFRFRDQNPSNPTELWRDEWVWYAKNNTAHFSKIGFQWDAMKFDEYGQVGIFTSGAPQARLDVNGETKTNYLSVRSQDGASEGGEISLAGSQGSPSWQMDVFSNTLRFHTNGTLPFQINPNGDISSAGTGHFNDIVLTGANAWLFQTPDDGRNDLLMLPSAPAPLYWDAAKQTKFKNNGDITVSGKIGIGTDSPGAYKLAVEGKIGAREVEVKTGSWADFVFQPDYRLRPLAEVATYVQVHHHLPEIPSEAEVKEKGISLGEMNAKLLQKIEELTLYMLEQQKEIDDLKRQVASKIK